MTFRTVGGGKTPQDFGGEKEKKRKRK